MACPNSRHKAGHAFLDDALLALLERAIREAESEHLDPKLLEALCSALGVVPPFAAEWADLSLVELRASIIGPMSSEEAHPEGQERLSAAAYCYAALTKVRDRFALEAALAMARRLSLPENLSYALAIIARGYPTKGSTPETKRTRKRLGFEREFRDGDFEFLKCTGWADVRARMLHLMYQESREAFLVEISENEHRLNTLKSSVLTASARTGMHLPPLVRSDPAAWLWRFEYLSGFYELPTVTILKLFADKAEWMIDGGAHIGCMSSLMKSFNASCQVWAIEPNPLLHEIARRNLSLPGVEVVVAALADAPGFSEFFPGDGHSNSSLIRGATCSTAPSVRVPSVTIDELLPRAFLRKPGVIKLDIEGFELEALHGARQVLQGCQECVLILENNPRLLRKKPQGISAVHEYLKSLGFVGRLILDAFALSRGGVIDESRTRNYIFAKTAFWDCLQSKLLS